VRACPTEKQYGSLRMLASGSAGLSWRKRETEPFLRRGWVTAELKDGLYQWVRITPDGLRALALAVEEYGLPDLGPKPTTHERYCGKCGSTRILTRSVEVKV
jgi:hypothetical protein